MIAQFCFRSTAMKKKRGQQKVRVEAIDGHGIPYGILLLTYYIPPVK